MGDLKRTAWKFLLPLAPHQRVLVLGDRDGAWAQSLRDQNMQILVAGRDFHWRQSFLPFPDAMFDTIIVDDFDRAVIEAGDGGNANFLNECGRVLKVDGSFALSVANRAAWQYRLRPGMPRRRGAIAVLRAALSERGFAHVASWMPFPGPHSLRYLWSLGPVSGTTPTAAAPAELGRRERLLYRLARSPLASWVVDTALVIARRSTAPSLGEQVLAQALGRDRFEIRQVRTGNPSSLIYRVRVGASDERMVRLPIGVEADARCARHWRALQAVDAPGLLPGTVPRALDHGTFAGQSYYCEAAVDGIPVDSAAYPLDRLMTQAAQRLIEFHQATMQPVKIDRSRFERHCASIFDHLARAGAPRKRLDNIYRYVHTRLSGATLPLVFLHGDYKIENMLVDAQDFRIRSIIDWDLSQAQGLPLFDLFYLFMYTDMRRSGTAFPQLFIERILPQRWRDDEARLLQDYLARIPVPPVALSPLLVLFWLHHIAYRYEVFRWPTPQTPRYFDDILATVERQLLNETPLPRGRVARNA